MPLPSYHADTVKDENNLRQSMLAPYTDISHSVDGGEESAPGSPERLGRPPVDPAGTAHQIEAPIAPTSSATSLSSLSLEPTSPADHINSSKETTHAQEIPKNLPTHKNNLEISPYGTSALTSNKTKNIILVGCPDVKGLSQLIPNSKFFNFSSFIFFFGKKYENFLVSKLEMSISLCIYINN